MSLIGDGMAFLQSSLSQAAPAVFTITRASTGQTSAAVTGWLGRTVFRQQGLSGQSAAQIVFGEDDAIIPTASYVLGGVATLPARGDRFTIDRFPGVTFETMAPGNEPHWRYSDQTRELVRVHLKRVG